MVSPCGILEDKVWKWYEGEGIDEKLGNFYFRRNYFDCASYFFDGEFNIAKFDKKIFLYHGSAMLASKVVAYPVGADFYKPAEKENNSLIEWLVASVSDENNWEKDIDELLSEKINVSSAWFADPSTAAMYSNFSKGEGSKERCGEKCVFAYETKKPLTIFLLDDPYNIAKILTSPDFLVEKSVKIALMSMFSIKNPEPVETLSNSPFSRFYYPDMVRHSSRDMDYIFNKWFCNTLSNKYDGYGATTQLVANKQIHGGKFHLEFAFCNPLKHLTRSYRNPIDWQYIDNKKIPPNTLRLLKEYFLYETTNVYFHAGNLLQHSVWTMLYSESISEFLCKNTQCLDGKIISLFAFLHDVGKINPNSPSIIKNLTRGVMIYYNQPEHNKIGAEYIKEDKVPIVNRNLNVVDYLKISSIFSELGINYNDDIKKLLAFVIDEHWYFGEYVLKKILIEGISVYEKSRNDYLKKISDDMKLYNIPQKKFLLVISTLLIIGYSDILGSQNFPSTFNEVKKNSRGNVVSKYFPFIGNLSKLYGGSQIPEKLKKDNLGIKVVSKILEDVKKELYESQFF